MSAGAGTTDATRHRHLTTQINIADDPLVQDDFAFATRDGLVPPLAHHADPAEARQRGVDGAFAEIEFDFVLQPAVAGVAGTEVHRERAHAA